MEKMPEEMQKDLVELWIMQTEINIHPELSNIGWIKDRTQQLLQKIKVFVDKYQPDGYSVSFGASGVNVTFRW
jgi:hypothetical protein